MYKYRSGGRLLNCRSSLMTLTYKHTASHQVMVINNIIYCEHTCINYIDVVLNVSSKIPFLHHQLLECDYNGKEYAIDGHDIALRIPIGAVPKGERLHFEVGVAMYGPFNFPNHVRPVSPIFWLRFIDKKVSLTVEIFLPHCFIGLTRDTKHDQEVSFVKADLKDINVNELRYNFHLHSDGANFLQSKSYGILETNQSGLFCITYPKTSNHSSINYYLARIDIPPVPPVHEFYFYILYNLSTHKKVGQLQSK